MHDCSQPKLDQPHLQEICRCMRSCLLYLDEITSSHKNTLTSFQWKAQSLTSTMVCDHFIIWSGWATKKNIPPIMLYTPSKKFNISLDFNILEKIKIWGKKAKKMGGGLLLKNWRFTIFSKWQIRNMTTVEVCFLLMINFHWSYNFCFQSCPGRKWQARTEWRRTSTETRGCPSWMILHRPRFFLFIRPNPIIAFALSLSH